MAKESSAKGCSIKTLNKEGSSVKQREIALWTSGEHFYTSAAFCSFERLPELPWMMTCEDWLFFFLHSLFGLCNINLLPISVGAGCKGRWQARHNCWESWRASAKLPDSTIRTLRGGRKKNLTMLPKNCLPVIVTAIRAAGGHPWHVTYPELLKLTPPKIPKRNRVWGWGKPSYKVSVYKTLMSGCGL